MPANRSAICTYCSTLVPVMLAITATFLVSSHGRSFSMKLSTPGFCRPTLLSMPLGVSAMREGGLPVRGSRLNPLTEMPPSWPISYSSSYSRPKPNVPLAAIIGFFSFTPHKSRERSATQTHLLRVEHRAVLTDARIVPAAVRLHDLHIAAQTGADAAAHPLFQ